MKQYKNILILLFLLLITFINQTYNFIELNIPFNFKNKDYLSLLNGALFADVFIMLVLIQYKYLSGKYIKLWYKKYHIFALIADIGSIILGVIIARYVIYKLQLKNINLFKFMLIVIGVQITHDLLFYLIFSNLPRGFNKMLDLFKDYAKEESYQAVVGDSIIMVITVLFSSLINKYSINFNIISLITQLYLTPYILFAK